MQKRLTIFSVGLLVVAPIVHAGIFARFANPKVGVTLTHPPGLGLEVDRIAFLNAEGECADELSNAIIEDFIRNDVEVLDRQNTQALLAEHDFGQSQYVSKNDVAALGELLGPTALLVVRVGRCATEENSVYDDVQTVNGEARVYISKTTGYLRGTIRVVDLATSRISSAKTIEQQYTDENTDYDGYPEHPSSFEVLDQVLAQATREVHRLFFPWYEQTELYFFNDDECGLREAFKLLKIGDVQGAAEASVANLEQCQQADVKRKFKARAFYNVGMTHFIQGEYEQALDYLQQAYQVKDTSIISESIQACRRAMSLEAQMEAMEQAEDFQVAVSPSGSGGDASRDITAGKASGGAAGSGSAPGSVESRLKKLKSLHEQGLLTQAEYEEKKAEILESL